MTQFEIYLLLFTDVLTANFAFNKGYESFEKNEIKNPYKFDETDDIKPEYLIQIYQQQYVLGLPLCDFIKTNIISNAGGYVNSLIDTIVTVDCTIIPLAW